MDYLQVNYYIILIYFKIYLFFKYIFRFKDNPTLMKEAFENYIDYHKDIRSPVIFIEFSDE